MNTTVRSLGVCCALALGLVVAPGVAQAAPSATIDRVQLLPRADLSIAAWNRTTDQYDEDYVYPATRTVRLTACSSRQVSGSADSGLPVFRWLLEPLEGQPLAVPISRGPLPPGQCITDVGLPAMGLWRLTLTTTDAAGLTASAMRTVRFRDVVVAAVGASFASGEGNRAKGPADFSAWIDGPCHRSYYAWPALLARDLENDSTAVTFLSYACSGADIEHLTSTNYSGLKGGQNLQPQLRALREALHDPVDPLTRPVDVLVGAIGLNTLNVAANLADCIKHLAPGVGPDCQKDFTGKFNRLPGRYDALELALSANLKLSQFHLLGYPSRILTDAQDNYPKKLTGVLCSLSPSCTTRATLCGPWANTTVSDKQWMTRSVETLNGLMRSATQRHGWTFSPTIDRFRRHGYCAPPGVSWFRSITGSVRQQGDHYGTAHPTRAGHIAAFEAVRPKVQLARTAPFPVTLALDVVRVQVTKPSFDRTKNERPPQVSAVNLKVLGVARARCGPAGFDPTAANGAKAFAAGPCRHFVVSTAGNTIAMTGSVTVGVWVPREPPIPGEPDAGHFEKSTLSVRRVHLRADNWNVAPPFLPGATPVQHLVAGSTTGKFGKLEVDYTITKPEVVLP